MEIYFNALSKTPDGNKHRTTKAVNADDTAYLKCSPEAGGNIFCVLENGVRGPVTEYRIDPKEADTILKQMTKAGLNIVRLPCSSNGSAYIHADNVKDVYYAPGTLPSHLFSPRAVVEFGSLHSTTVNGFRSLVRREINSARMYSSNPTLELL